VRGTPVLLLTTTGRKSGERRTRPVGYLPDGDRFLVCGSNGGSDHPPAWSLNLRARMPPSGGRQDIVGDGVGDHRRGVRDRVG